MIIMPHDAWVLIRVQNRYQQKNRDWVLITVLWPELHPLHDPDLLFCQLVKLVDQGVLSARRWPRSGAERVFARDHHWMHGTGNRFIQADPSVHIDLCVEGTLWPRKR